MSENHSLNNDQDMMDKFSQNSVVYLLIKTNIDLSRFQIGNINTDRSTNSHDKMDINSNNIEDEDEYIMKTLCSSQKRIIFFIMAICLILILLLYLILHTMRII